MEEKINEINECMKSFSKAREKLILEIGSHILHSGKETDKEVLENKASIKYYDGMIYAFKICLSLLKNK